MRTLLYLGLSLLIGCAQAPEPGVLRIATDATFPPFHYREQSEVTGFDVELARAVASVSGAAAEVRVLTYDALWSGLEDGAHDIVAASTGVTAEREARYLFSSPYYATCQVAVVRARSAATHVAHLADLTVGAEGSGTSYLALQSLSVRQRTRLEDGQGQMSVEAGEIDAWIVDEYAGVRAAEESNGRLRVLPESVAVEQYALVLARGDTQLKARVDTALKELRDSGRLARLAQEFGLLRGPRWPVQCQAE